MSGAAGRVARHRVLPSQGRLLVSTDLHGNLEDFEALRARFAAMAEDGTSHWVQLGDLVHAPSAEAAARHPDTYDAREGSGAIVDGFLEAQRRWAGRVHVVLGNHDHAHVGGPATSKFHPDEAAWLEARLDGAAVERMRELFRSALLAVVAPCGVLLTHGSPGALFSALEDFDALPLEGYAGNPVAAEQLRSLLTSYGQPAAETKALLERLSRPGLGLSVVVHGHDRDRNGWFTEGGNQVCPVIFGAAREQKRCLVLDLAGRYRSADDFRDGIEVQRVHGPVGV